MPSSAWTVTANPISLAPVTTSIGSSPENINYLTNADKIALMAQYAAMLATKTTLDETAASLSIDSSYYDNACAGISTALISAGAPSNWATTWPDGTTSGPWPNIQGILANLWAQIASQQTALQSAISAQQAAAAEAAAIAASASAATVQLNAAVSTLDNAAPVVVSGLPSLPDAAFPIGKLVWDASHSLLYSNIGNVWTPLAVPATNITGTLTASQIASLATAQLTGQITSTQISDGAVSTPQLAAGSVTAEQIAAGAVTAGSIATGAVTAGAIAAGAVTAGAIAANTITAGQIAAGAIGATQIAAGSVIASKLTLTDTTNICGNGSGASGTDGWLGLISAYPNYFVYGQSAILTTGDRDAFWAPGVINVTPGEAFSFSAYCCPGNQAVSQAAPLGAFNIGFELGNDPSFASPAFVAAAGAPASSTSSWVLVTGQVVIPAGCTVARIWVQINAANGSTGVWAFTALTVRKAASGELLVDGTVTASKIAAGAITADMITTGTLNAALVSVTNLNASNVTTGTLAATKVLFSDGSSLNTASRVVTSSIESQSTYIPASGTIAPVPPFGWSVVSSSTQNTFNINGTISYSPLSSDTPDPTSKIHIVVDGNTANPIVSFALPGAGSWFALIGSVTGIPPGAHTIQLYASSSSGNTSINSGSYVVLQRIY